MLLTMTLKKMDRCIRAQKATVILTEGERGFGLSHNP